MQQEKIADIISRLKKIREENDLSYKKIVDMVEKNGEYVSLSTVRRVFEDGSEAYGYQYDNTLRPIADAVLGVYGEPDGIDDDNDTVEALRAVIRYKNERLKELESRLKQTEESYRRRLDFVKEQIALKDSRIDRRDSMIEKLLDTLLIFKQRGCDKCVCDSRPEAGGNHHIPKKKPHR